MRLFVAISLALVCAMLSTEPVWSQTLTSTTCTQSGAFVTDPSSGCKQFYQCWGGYLYQYTCPWGTVFNPNRNYCDWVDNYVCPTPPTTTTTTAKTTTGKAVTSNNAAVYTGPYAQQYGQCAGYYYHGSNVCPPGFYCKYNSEWYSECVVDPSATTTTSTTTTTTCAVKTTTSSGTTKAGSTTASTKAGSTTATTTAKSGSTTASTTTKAGSTTTTTSGKYLITYDEFKNALSLNGCPIASEDKYLAMVSQAGPSGHIYDKQHLAMFLAQIMWESDCLLATNEYACANGCPNAYPSSNGKDYHGRGYIQLTWDYNYAACSRDLYGDDRLIQNPDQVATDQNVAWATAFWYWSRVVAPRAGVINYEFGDSTMAINGALECGSYNTRARARYDRYVNTLKAFGITATPIEKGCYN